MPHHPKEETTEGSTYIVQAPALKQFNTSVLTTLPVQTSPTRSQRSRRTQLHLTIRCTRKITATQHRAARRRLKTITPRYALHPSHCTNTPPSCSGSSSCKGQVDWIRSTVQDLTAFTRPSLHVYSAVKHTANDNMANRDQSSTRTLANQRVKRS